MSPFLDDLRAQLAHQEAIIRTYTIAGANAGQEEALACHDAVVEAQKRARGLRERIKATEANEQRAEKGAGR